MCEFMSFLVHDEGDRVPLPNRYRFADFTSHGGTAKAHGITYGNPDIWREAEWTAEDDGQSLVVRATETQRASLLKATILADFPTRADALKFGLQNLPDGLQTLGLDDATVPEEVRFPDGLKTLWLNGATLHEGVHFPDGLQTLGLGGATLFEGVHFPDGLQTLGLGGATLPEGVRFPDGCQVFGSWRRAA